MVKKLKHRFSKILKKMRKMRLKEKEVLKVNSIQINLYAIFLLLLYFGYSYFNCQSELTK